MWKFYPLATGKSEKNFYILSANTIKSRKPGTALPKLICGFSNIFFSARNLLVDQFHCGMLANKDIKIAWFLDNVIARMLQLVKDLPGSTSMLHCAQVIWKFSTLTITILRDFKNAPFYNHCLFHMVDLRMFSLSFLSSCTMNQDLPWSRFAHTVHSDVIPTLVFFNNRHLTNVNLIQFENKHFDVVARFLN